MENSKFQIFKRRLSGEFYYRLRAQSGQIILRGTGYKTKLMCKRQIVWIKSNALDDARYERHDQSGNYQFQLRKSEHEVIGDKSIYLTDRDRDKGIEDVKRYATVAGIEDLSVGIFI